MDTRPLKTFAQAARQKLREQVESRLHFWREQDSAEHREHARAIKQMEAAVRREGHDQLVERVAYTWFNRLVALRYMDVRGFQPEGVQVVSPLEAGQEPELLNRATRQFFPDNLPPEKQDFILKLFVGDIPSNNPYNEAFRILLTHTCNQLYKVFPYLFEPIDHYTELLLPDDLTSPRSILEDIRQVMTEDACQDVEIIGWLYQFYISEKKDQVFAGLKKNQKITPENIPAATQLFTPHWIVRYLVENSLGRLWLLNRPGSKLAERMDYYIAPEEEAREQGSGSGEGTQQHHHDQKLSGSDRLAEGHGTRDRGVRGNEAVSPGGALRAEQSTAPGGRIDSLQHRRGARPQEQSSLQPLPFDREGQPGGSGNADHHRPEAGLHRAGHRGTAPGQDHRDRQDAQHASPKTEPQTLKPEASYSEEASDFLRVSNPTEIKICDPACGSGHMLTYAFDLLYAIYEEEGYDPAAIPSLILTHNLTGIEIDDRAGALAAFALAMKAAEKLGRRKFRRMKVQPHILVLQNVSFSEEQMEQVKAMVGEERFTDALRETLGQFGQARNFGSLIVPKLRDPAETLRVVEARDFGGDLLLKEVQERVVAVLRMAAALSPKYHVVVANPPYKKKGDLNSQLQTFLVEKFPDCFSDLYAAFIDRLSKLACNHGYFAMIAMDSWLFGDDYTEMRARLMTAAPFRQLAHLGPRAFDEIKGEVVQVAGFASQKNGDPNREAQFFDLTDGQTSGEKASMLRKRYGEHRAKGSDFTRLPRNVVAYFVSDHTRDAYANGTPLKEYAEAFTGLQTGDNPRFIRSWAEVDRNAIDFNVTPETKSNWLGKWVPYVKGSDFRKWYGNQEFILDWEADGRDIKAHKSATVRNEKYYFRDGAAYNTIASKLSVRRVSHGHVFDQKNSMFFGDSRRALDFTLGFLHSKVVPPLLRVVAAKDFGPGSMKLLPVFKDYDGVSVSHLADDLVELAKSDWDAYETSWDFTTLPLLSSDHRGETLEATYARLRAHWQSMTDEMQRLEEANNRIFIDAYGLQDELTPEVPIEEITLTCNPAYRYGLKGTEADRETRLRADTMAEFLSYAVGCMFGRYSLDAPGLILANQGETLEDYLRKVKPGLRANASDPNQAVYELEGMTSDEALHDEPESLSPSFLPDEDNVIPFLDTDWFPDDLTERFQAFLRVTFGEAHFRQNREFIEEALGKDLRKYFTRNFYKDHVQRYKKRPIYWMFSSLEGHFNVLIYMHRYQRDTLYTILNKYLRPFITKLEAEARRLEEVEIKGDTRSRNEAMRRQETVRRQLQDARHYEQDILAPLAAERIAIDLDDGVLVNYNKFGSAVRKVPGLNDEKAKKKVRQFTWTDTSPIR